MTDQGSPLARRERLKILTERIDQLLAESGQLDVSLDEIIKLLNQRHSVITRSRLKEASNG